MGCGCCREEKRREEEEGEPVDLSPIVPVYSTVGSHPSAIPLGPKHDPLANLKIDCGGLFVTGSADATVDLLFLYPDAAYAHRQPTKKLEKQDDVTERGRVPWKSVRVEMKEFDSVDDVTKEWYDDGGQIPGVELIESAGALGGWARVKAHCYQQRFVLPGGRRLQHPLVDKGFKPSKTLREPDLEVERPTTYLSIPQRLNRIYKAHGEKIIKQFVHRIKASWIQIRIAALAVPGGNDAITAIDWRGAADAIIEEMDQADTYQTVHDFKNELLKPVVDILAEIEDGLMYNWFDIAVFAEMEIGKYRGTPDGPLKQSKSIWDRLLSHCVDGVDNLGDKAVVTLRDLISGRMTQIIRQYLDKQDENDKEDDLEEDLVDLLFPDISDIVQRAVQCVDVEATGLNSDVGNNEHFLKDLPEGSTITNIDQLLAEWRAEDERPLEVRREEFYEQMIEYAEDLGDATIYFKRARFQKELCLHPHLLPTRFQKYTMYLVFPEYSESDKDDMKKPKNAMLRLWPEGGDVSKARRISMKEFSIVRNEDEGVLDKVHNFLASVAADGFDEGDSSIDSDDDTDPRNKWVDYPDKHFRGFECEIEAAVDCTYFFNFDLDGVLFLDHDSYYLKEQGSEEIFGRKVKFHAMARPLTINPLITAGMALQ